MADFFVATAMLVWVNHSNGSVRLPVSCLGTGTTAVSRAHLQLWHADDEVAREWQGLGVGEGGAGSCRGLLPCMPCSVGPYIW